MIYKAFNTQSIISKVTVSLITTTCSVLRLYKKLRIHAFIMLKVISPNHARR